MSGLEKHGPKHKKRKKNTNQELLPTRKFTDEDFKRMMEDAPVYKRSHGALRQLR